MAIAALDIGGTNIKHCLFPSGGDFRAANVAATPSQAAKGAQALLGRIYAILDEMAEVGFDAIGVSTAGQVDPVSGCILEASEHIPGYAGTPLGSLLFQRYTVPVAVENDVNAAMVGELFCAPGERGGVVLGLTYGTGVGGCIFMDGQLFHGKDYAAGEFGHIITRAGDGRSCVCGRRGCYEAQAATSVLIQRAREELGESLDGRRLIARRSEPAVAALLDSWLEDVLHGLVSLVYTFHPARLILGGGIMENPFLIKDIEKRLKARVMPVYRDVQVQGTHFGNGAGLRGAIHLAQRRMEP